MRAQLLALALVLLLAPLSASASFHLWNITEVYSNADGSVQFVELEVCATVVCSQENLLTGQTIQSNANSYPFPNNLPAGTAGHHFLIATPAFAAQPGAVPPDYTFPAANFMSLVADTINYAGGVDLFTYHVDELPTDGFFSLNEPFGSDVRTKAPNSPTNFAGQVGPEPSAWLLQLTGAAAVFGLARSKTRSASRSNR